MALGGALRIILRPFSSSRPVAQFSVQLCSRVSSTSPFPSTSIIQKDFVVRSFSRTLFERFFSTAGTGGAPFNSLTDMRFPKRRPGLKPRRKRASLRQKGPYVWVQYVPGEPTPSSRPNEGSIKGTKRKKRIKQRKAFILAEKKKRKAQYAEFRKKKEMERIERQMAAVAREKAWVERLIELQQLEVAKKAAMA